MPRSAHLVVSISSHGYGHAAQVLPVIALLRRRIPGLRVSLRTALPRQLLEARLGTGWDYLAETGDFGMIMKSAVEVRVDESAAAYRAFHCNWDRKVTAEAQRLRALAPDLVLADIAYLPLAGAAAAGIPAVALCCLNWADIYRHYCGAQPEAPAIVDQMLAAYNSAAAFLQIEPSMPMPGIRNGRPAGVIAQLGVDRRAELDARLRLGRNRRLIVITLGGIPLPLDLNCWPRLPGVHWVGDRDIAGARADIVSIDTLGITFPDLLRSCDALVTKPGYGIFAEAACNGVPLLYIRRPDWPEEPVLVRWLNGHARSLEITRDQLERGDIGDALAALWSAPRPPSVVPLGIAQTASYLAQWLARNDGPGA
ncbi:MAG: hypothetical protein M0Z84_02675 [Gammaproteobacteria bacterium]|nr:hypothetical protein [Gammaproteobacteria bacterium]